MTEEQLSMHIHNHIRTLALLTFRHSHINPKQVFKAYQDQTLEWAKTPKLSIHVANHLVLSAASLTTDHLQNLQLHSLHELTLISIEISHI